MKAPLKHITATGLLLVMLLPLNLLAQFEQKLTINAGVAYLIPNTHSDDLYFNHGLGIDGGIQFNTNRRFSLFGNARFYYMFNNDDNSYYDNLALGGGGKLNLLIGKPINPYLYGEVNVNFIWIEDFVPMPDASRSFYQEDFGTSLGFNGGLGFDFNIGQNFDLFLQGGPYYTIWDGFTNIYVLAGLRINLIKSKSI
jgi:hypothetical protein